MILRVFSLTWPASIQIYWNKRKRLHKKRVQLRQDWFGTPTWPPLHCFGTPIWPPWRHVKTLYYLVQVYNVLTSKYIDDSWNLLTLNEDSKFQLFFFNYYFLLMFFLRCPMSPKAIHNNTGSFCHKCSEPLNVRQWNLALWVAILCMFYYLLSVADCFEF